MKRILFLLHLPPPIHGAAMVGKYIQESKIINNQFDTNFINLSTSKTLNDIGQNGKGKIGSLLYLLNKVIKSVSSNKFDLCYMTLSTNGLGFYKDFLIVILLKLYRVKIIYHFHNKGFFEKQNKFFNHILYKITFRKTMSILISKYLYYDIQKYVNNNDVFYCHNGIPKIDLSLPILKNDIEVKPFSILFLSNMMIEKGVFVLLEACNILKSRKVSFECNFVGAWSDITKEIFDEYVSELDLNQYVFAHGKKYDEEKLQFFNEADVFVFPTFYHNETFGLVLLEAMQHSLPVISCSEGGIPDVVQDGNTGFLVPKKDSLALAEKIEVLINNPKLIKEMGQAGKMRYSELFTLEKFENNLCDIIKQAIEK
ncbi:glycosyltransferase family 4 protein [Flavobacterium luteum]|nr:glycosyltransferase family 4 protein [Flavobacterium luteum]